MVDGQNLHPKYGLNPMVKVCIHCGVDEGLYFMGNTIEEQAPQTELIECFGFCTNNNLVALIEVDDVEGRPVGYRVIMKVDKARKKWQTMRFEPGQVLLIPSSQFKKMLKNDYHKEIITP